MGENARRAGLSRSLALLVDLAGLNTTITQPHETKLHAELTSMRLVFISMFTEQTCI